jgi:enamine deaminase RidA (YjgF/YER057c/UK114 family)
VSELANHPAVPGAWEKTVLVADERRPAVPAVIRFGPHLFVSGSEGHRRLTDEVVDPELADDADAQCRNAYGRIAERLKKAGYSGECVVSVQNFTSSQHWRAQRMNLWPPFFGEENHRKTVSFGAQARMNGINMLTAVAWAMDPAVPRHVAVPSPSRGRASRITRAGNLTFVIGVRAHGESKSGAPIPEENDESFAAQLDACFDALQSHLAADNLTPDHFVRVDATLRAARFVPPFEAGVRQRFDKRVPFALYSVGMPLGARGEMEIGGVALSAGVKKTLHWSKRDPSRVDVAVGGGLAFVRSVCGAIDEHTGAQLTPLPDWRAQVRQAVTNVETLLDAAGVGSDALLRFDVFLRDIYAQEAVLDELSSLLGKRMPVVSFLGAEPGHHAEIEIAAVAGNTNHES